ncbi:protein NLRC3 isoform X1 [Gigaspora margarita]|uniref:Protein NLRC3 isoform X1 n=1 Tax=Gigaspora margarita TaxID=4874 RepID=A0A8H4AYW7_GIGMA|nr:protein NLRC3 isoform X1 [Gigaspora margarita]
MTLSFDCISEIFGHLVDYKTLFSCLVANRDCCRLAAPMLWRKPNLRHPQLVETLLLGLDAVERALIPNVDRVIPNDRPALLFEYARFISKFSTNDLNRGIKSWLNDETSDESSGFIVLVPIVVMFLRTNNDFELNIEELYGITLDLGSNVTESEDLMNNFDFAGGKALALALKMNNALTSFDITNTRIGGKVAKELSDALIENKSLTSINISSNNIGPFCGKALADVLKANTPLTSLDISHTRIKSNGNGMGLLTEALFKNKTLTSLSLKYNELISEDGENLAAILCENNALTTLDISNNLICDKGGSAIAAALCKNKKLTSLIIAFNRLNINVGEAFAEALDVNNTLTSLDLSDNPLSVENGSEEFERSFNIRSTLTVLL